MAADDETGDNNAVSTGPSSMSDKRAGRRSPSVAEGKRHGGEALRARPESPSLNYAGHGGSNGVVTLVEAVMLSTTVPPAAGNSNTHPQTFARPIFASPTAVLTGLLPPMGSDFDEALHVFAGTICALQAVVRIVGEDGERVNIFCHEVVMEGKTIKQLDVRNLGPLETMDSSLGSVYLVTLCPFVISERCGSSRRLQIFDFQQRLVFTREWNFEVGMLNDDAVDWLRASHVSLPQLIESDASSSSRHDAGPKEARPSTEAKVFYPHETAGHSRIGSFSTSFLELEDDSHRLSRSDSIITLDSSRSSRGASHGPKTVDMIAQVGFWLYGTKFGQIMMANANDPRENAKTFFSPSPIWMLGIRFVNDKWNSSQWKRVVCLGSVQRVIPFVSSRQDRLHPMQGPIPEDAYVLRETLSLRPAIVIEALIPLLASWLEANKWEAGYELLEGPTIVLQAGQAETRFSIVLQVIDAEVVLNCRIVASQTDAMKARTCFVDILSELMSLISAEGHGSTSLEFLLLRAVGASVEMKPALHSLIRIYPSQHLEASLDDRARHVLLWSDHIHDWIMRDLVHGSFSHHDGPHDNVALFIKSPLMDIESMPIDILKLALYLVDDGTWRFALSHVDTGSWFCFKASSREHFSDILSWLTTLIKAAMNQAEECVDCALQTPKSAPYSFPLSEPSSPSSLTPKRLETPGKSLLESTSGRRRKKVDAQLGMDAFWRAFEALFWFTYRKDFPRLVPSILSSDVGFGCMIRAGQSMMAEALARLYLGRVRSLAKIFADPQLTERYQMV